jgi:hypothetical protein
VNRTPIAIAVLSLMGALAFVLTSTRVENIAVVYPQGATALEKFSAREIQRYFFVRTGVLASLVEANDIPNGFDRYIFIGHKGDTLFSRLDNAADILASSKDLVGEEYAIRTSSASHTPRHVIVGGDEAGVLYGAYRFIEATGVHFAIDADIIPDGRYDLQTLNVNETGKPLFRKRGLQPFHDFNVGPDWWNQHDYKNVLSQMVKLRMNFIGFHTYPSWNPAAGPEANVWIGLPEDVDKQGNVRSGYEAGVVTTRRGWEVKPFRTSQYAGGAGLLFGDDDYGPDFMLDCLEWPKTDSAAAAMFNRYGDFQESVFNDARSLGIQTCVGTELPLGVPPLLASRLRSQGMRSDDPVVIRKLYEGTFLRLMRKMPVDYYWLWLPEIWLFSDPGCAGWEITTEGNVARDIALVESAARHVNAPFGFATSGWRLGTRHDPLWMDKRAPGSWAISSINTSAGRDPVEKTYGRITGRPKWVIGWAEDDDAARAHCCTTWDLQLWVGRMLNNTADASRYGCEGMLAIHWRTASIAPNLSALAGAGWSFQHPEDRDSSSMAVPAATTFWEEWGRNTFGGDAGARVGRLMGRFDGGHLLINAMINNGRNTTDSVMERSFAPLRELEALRPRVRGTGNLERLDYWVNYIKATRERVRTWVLASRFDSLISEMKTMHDGEEKTRVLRGEVLPLRVAIARSYEEMISAFVACAKSPGEVGTIASIESGNRSRIVNAYDTTLMKMLGGPLPEEASVSTAYHGTPRIFVSSSCTQWRVGEPLELRPFVLSESHCARVQLHWRLLGERSFRTVTAVHRARQAYRVNLPTSVEGTVEYFLEATLEDGQEAFSPVTAPSINHTVVVW